MGVQSFTCTAFAVGGGPASGALTDVYIRNTDTRVVIYSDSDLTIPATNPTVADADGRVAPIYFDDTLELRFNVSTSDRATTLLQVDYRDGTFSVTFVQFDQLQLFEQIQDGDGIEDTFVLPGVIASSPYHIDITINGLLQPKTSYNVSSDGTDTTVIFDTPPASGTDNVVFTSAIMQGVPGPAGPPGDQLAIYDTLADIMAISGADVEAGAILATRGHTTATDGCAAEYVILGTLPKLSDGTDIPVDNTGCVNALSGAKWAVHQDYAKRKIIHPRMFGAPGDGSNQDTQLDNLWDCYAGLAILNHGSSPYSVLFGSRLPEQPEIIIDPGVYARATYSAREFNYAGGFSIRASQGAVLTKQGFRFKGLNGFVSGLCPIGENVANSYGIHCGDADFDTNDGTLYWQFENCVPEKFAVNWLITADVESSFNQCRANGALLINRAILRAQDSHWVGYRGTRSGGKWGTLIQPWGTGAFSINVGGCHFTDDAERKAEGRNAFVTGGDGITSLTTADDPYIWVPNGYASVKIAASWECYYTDCDWANDSEESNNPTRRNLVVTSMVQSPANASFTRVTTSTPHFLQHLMDIGHAFYEFTSCGDFSGASGSGSGLTIRTIISTTVFDCDINPAGKASFSGTGNLALPEYNLAIYGQSAGWAAENLNSHKFVGGHSNWTLWGRSRNVQWLGFRHKQDLVADGPGYILGGIVEECFTGDLAAPSSFDNNIRIVGGGSVDIARHGSKDFNLADSVTRVSNDFGQSMERPLSASGVAADGGAAKVVRFATKYDRGELGITTALTGVLTGAYFNETALNFVTADAAGFPIRSAQVKATGGVADRTLEARFAEVINILDFYPNGYTTPADGTSHSLTSFFGSLGAAQVVYPFAVGGNQQIDSCAGHAMQLVLNASAGTGDRIIRFPHGSYNIGAATISSCAAGTGTNVVFTTAATHQLFVGCYVGIGYTKDYNGVFLVTAATGTTFTVDIPAGFGLIGGHVIAGGFTTSQTGTAQYIFRSTAAGQVFRGDGGDLTQIIGAGFDLAHSDVVLEDMYRTGAGLCFARFSGSSSRRRTIRKTKATGAIFGLLPYDGGADHVISNDFTGCYFGIRAPDNKSPSVDTTVTDTNLQNSLVANVWGLTGEWKFIGGQSDGAAAFGNMVKDRSIAATVGVYFGSGFTQTAQAVPTFASITAVADAGGGNCTFTCTNTFFAGDKVELFGTTDYNGTKTIISATATSFVAAATFGVTRTGSVRRLYQRVWRILSTSDCDVTGAPAVGGGYIKVTTDGSHDLETGFQGAVITSTTNYNGTALVVIKRVSSTELVIQKSYVSSQTGFIAVVNWDVIVDGSYGGGGNTDVRDIYFEGHNINTFLLGPSSNVHLDLFWIKQQVWKTGGQYAHIRRTQQGRKEDGSIGYANILMAGPDAAQGWTEISSSIDAGTGKTCLEMIAPYAATAVDTVTLRPALNKVRLLETGIEMTVNSVAVANLTASLLSTTLPLLALSGTAVPAGGTAGAGLRLSATSNLGLFFGSGAPSLSAAKGSVYMRTDGSTVNDRMYVNTNGSTTWTAVITAA